MARWRGGEAKHSAFTHSSEQLPALAAKGSPEKAEHLAERQLCGEQRQQQQQVSGV